MYKNNKETLVKYIFSKKSVDILFGCRHSKMSKNKSKKKIPFSPGIYKFDKSIKP